MNENRCFWVYREEGWDNAPEKCKQSLGTLYKNHPGREIVKLHKNNVARYVDFEACEQKDFWARDNLPERLRYIRESLLREYGGVWVDTAKLS